jgi:dipeptidyl aminopeptidase/acylaminoacyl peptidase
MFQPKRSCWFAVIAGAALSGPAPAVPRLPLEDFIREPGFSQMQISGDGQYIAYMRDYEGHSTVYTCDLATMEGTPFTLGSTQAFGTIMPREVESFRWVGDKRLLLTSTVWDAWFGTKAVNRDGSNWKPVSGYEILPLNQGLLVNVSAKDVLWALRVIYAFNDADQNILMLDQHDYAGKSILYPDVIKIDTVTGDMNRAVKNPGNVTGWGVDHAGQVRIGLVAEGGLQFGFIYRDNEAAPWRKLTLPKDLRDPQVLGFDQTDRNLYVSALSPERRTAIYLLTLGDPPTTQRVISDPEYDIVSELYTPAVDGVPMARTVMSEKKQSLVGVWYLRDAPRVQWFDKDFMTYQRAIDRMLPNTINLYVNQSRDDQRVLYLAFSDRDPGTYYLLDSGKHTIKPIAPRMPQIKAQQMAEMLSVHYAARDGLVIQGYLTLPVGYPPKQLPLIVMPHGGPWVRDVWGFNPLVQMLANRGYAVLQMNYRGSTGYGVEFYRKGRREVGLAIQDDIEDGTKWAITAGVADPKRVAIIGGSYGGYSALFALGRSPGLYQCGISFAGVTDWFSIYRNLDDPEYAFSRRYWEREIGDPRTDEAFLKSISPVNFAGSITAPVLIIQGKDDRTVPPKQARTMIAALEQAGRKPETLFISELGHYVFATEKSRRAIFKAIESFLEQHLGSGVPPAETKSN